MVTTFEKARSRSGPSFAGEQTRDGVVRRVDSNPPMKGPGCLNGVGAKRSGKGSAMDYIASVRVIDSMSRTVVTHRDFRDI